MKNQALRFLALLAGWLTVAIFATQQTVAMMQDAGQPKNWAEILPFHLAGCLIWVPLTLFLMALVSRYPLGGKGKLVSILVFSAGVVFCCVVKAIMVAAFNGNSGFWYDGPVPFSTVVLDSIRNNFVVGWLIIVLAHAIYFYDNDKKNQLLVAQLQAGLNKTQLEALAARLNPHFMFNTLNTIMELIHTDPDGAESMLQGLSALLRRSLDSKEPSQVTLQEELTFIDQYIAIQSVRFGDRLNYQTNIESGALNCAVPIMLLQPLIENAVEHGVAASSQPSTVIVNVRLSNQSLILSVDSPYISGNQSKSGFGIGLSATEARLKLIYANRQSLSVTHDVAGRILVTIMIISDDFLTSSISQSTPPSTRLAEQIGD